MVGTNSVRPKDQTAHVHAQKISQNGRTELIIGVSKAKFHEESFAVLQNSVYPPKNNKNVQKTFSKFENKVEKNFSALKHKMSGIV